MTAVAAALPVGLKLLDVAGNAVHLESFELESLGGSLSTTASGQLTDERSKPQSTAAVTSCCHLHVTGHYLVVYPADDFANTE